MPKVGVSFSRPLRIRGEAHQDLYILTRSLSDDLLVPEQWDDNAVAAQSVPNREKGGGRKRKRGSKLLRAGRLC